MSALLIFMISLASAYYSGNTINLEKLGFLLLVLFSLGALVGSFLWVLKKKFKEIPSFWSRKKKEIFK